MSNQIKCYLCEKEILDLYDAEFFNVRIEEVGLYHREIAHKTCLETYSIAHRVIRVGE